MDKNNATENQLLMAMAYGKAMRSRDDDEHEALLEHSYEYAALVTVKECNQALHLAEEFMTKEDFDYWKAQDPFGFACSNGAEKHYGGAY